MNNKLYVAMTDTFMSGWGKAENRINKYIVACDNQQQAEQIEAAAKKRSEMKYITVYTGIPNYDPCEYLVSMKHYNDLEDVWTDGKYKTDEEEEI